ncbi:MAG TPA: immunoglobulin domain-containing protein, partial [Opitutaceae bacterium]|nr:immunoglobulin domain-containing protein [Opitutaceae bacterium]
ASVTFSVTAGGSPAPTYQWQKDGGTIAGATTSSYTIASVAAADAGNYAVIATNSAGSATSNAAMLTVTRAVTTPSNASSGLFQYPAGVGGDRSGNFYVTDTSSSTVRKISSAGLVSTLAGTAGVAGAQDGAGGVALFNQPAGLAVDGTGDVFVADTGNATIREISPGGTVTTLAGSSASRGSQDGMGAAASFSSPVGLAVDGAGNVFVADAFSATIRKITPAGAVATLAGSAMNRGDADGTGTAALFNYPNGVAVDGVGNVYVADTYTDTIRRITPAGAVTTIAGSAGISGAADLPGRSALFNQPCGVAVDAAGNIFVADTGNGTIRKITPAGAVSTVAGAAGVAGFGDGMGANALFNQPHGLWIDSSGNLIVADTGNAALRMIAPNGLVTTPALAAAPTPAPTPPPPGGGTTTPAAGSGPAMGGGGAMPFGFVGLLVMLLAARGLLRSRQDHLGSA